MLKNQSEVVFLSWLAGVLVMAEGMQEGMSSVTGQMWPDEEKHTFNT